MIDEKQIWMSWIGKRVVKKSGKPFKSKSLEEIPVEFTVNPHSSKVGFRMADGNIVDCHMVTLVE